MTKPKRSGKVYLVGAGPGDPGLLTLKGKECLEAADVVLHTIISPIRSYCSMLRPRRSESMSVGGDVGSIRSKPISIDCSLNAPKKGTW